MGHTSIKLAISLLQLTSFLYILQGILQWFLINIIIKFPSLYIFYCVVQTRWIVQEAEKNLGK